MSDQQQGQSGAPAVDWGADTRAGLVVFLVALPLCLGIALASGAPLMSGLVTGLVGGLVVSAIGGTSLLVSGPAAGLAAIVLAAITELGTFEAFLAATVVAGLLQAGMALVRAGRLASLVPSSVVTGMLAAIGVLLILQQLPYALGATVERGHGLEMLLVPFRALPHATFGPTLVALVSLALLLVWERPALKAVGKTAPGPLMAVLGGTLVAEILAFAAPDLAVAASQKVDLPAIGLGTLGSLLVFPDFGALASGATWRVAVTLAIVASLETLLSMQATDRMDPWRRQSNGDRELFAQGVGNTLAGLIGGLPMTGVIVRSAANINAGGRSWRSAFVHGVLLGAAVISVPFLLERIPLAALAAVLVHTGWKLAHPSRFLQAFRTGPPYAVPLVSTVVAVVATDLLIGVGVGLVVGLAWAAIRGRTGSMDLKVDGEGAEARMQLELADHVTFVHKPRIHRVLEGAPPGARLTIDASRTQGLDQDVVELLHGFAETARSRSIQYQLVGVPGSSGAGGH